MHETEANPKTYQKNKNRPYKEQRQKTVSYVC